MYSPLRYSNTESTRGWTKSSSHLPDTFVYPPGMRWNVLTTVNNWDLHWDTNINVFSFLLIIFHPGPSLVRHNTYPYGETA